MIEDSKGSSGVWTFWLGFIGLTFWLGFIGNMDLLARVHRVDLLARFIGTLDLLARVRGPCKDLVCRDVPIFLRRSVVPASKLVVSRAVRHRRAWGELEE